MKYAKEYLMIEITNRWNDKFLQVMNDQDELGGLIDCDVPHKVIGKVCDDQEYGDRCTVDCPLFRAGTCPATTMRDDRGQLWHVLKYKQIDYGQ